MIDVYFDLMGSSSAKFYTRPSDNFRFIGRPDGVFGEGGDLKTSASRLTKKGVAVLWKDLGLTGVESEYIYYYF